MRCDEQDPPSQQTKFLLRINRHFNNTWSIKLIAVKNNVVFMNRNELTYEGKLVKKDFLLNRILIQYESSKKNNYPLNNPPQSKKKATNILNSDCPVTYQ